MIPVLPTQEYADLLMLLIAIAVGFAGGYLLAGLGPDHHRRRR